MSPPAPSPARSTANTRRSRKPTWRSSRRRRYRAWARSAVSRLQIEDRGNLGYDELYKETHERHRARAAACRNWRGLFTSYTVNVPQVDADIDRVKAKTHGVAISDIFDTLQVYLGSLYVNDFNRFGRTYQVNVQANTQFRQDAEQIASAESAQQPG